jgi:hypothetical protein
MKTRIRTSSRFAASILSMEVMVVPLALAAVLLSSDGALAQVLPSTRANDARGVSGCIQTRTGITCPNRGSESGSSGYGGLTPTDRAMLNLFGVISNEVGKAMANEMECILNPNCPRNLRLQQLEDQQQQLRQQMEEQARIRREMDERRRREFEEAKARMLGQMRGPKSEDLQPRSLETLQVQEVDSILGTTILKPRDLSTPTPPPSAKPSSTAWLQKANCSVYLLQKANKAASDGQYQEAAYLSNEAAALSSGAKASAGVVCPALREVPDVQGAPIQESQAVAETVQKQTILYSRLFSKAAQQMEDYRKVSRSVEKAEQRVDEAKERKQEAETRKEEIENQLQAEPEEKGQSAMAEALAALERAKSALADTEQVLAEEKKSQQQMEDNMHKTRDMFMQAKEKPETIDEIMGQLSQQ